MDPEKVESPNSPIKQNKKCKSSNLHQSSKTLENKANRLKTNQQRSRHLRERGASFKSTSDRL